MKKILLLLLSTLLYITHQAQLVATIPKVQESGYYRIKLSPAMIAVTTEQATNIRIYNSQHIAQPFVMNVATQRSVSTTSTVLQYQTLQNDTSISWIIDGVTNGLRDIVLYSNNTSTQPLLEAIGSNDQKNWYNIKERVDVPLAFNNRTYQATITLPPHNYKYLQLKQVDGKARLDLYRFATIATTTSAATAPQALAWLALRQIDSANGNSYLYGTFTARNTVDAIELKVQEKLLFERTINLYQRGKILQSWQFNQQQIGQLQLASSITTDSLLITIENGDNPPLHWQVQAWQQQRYLLCYLTADEQYNIDFGNANTPAPNYDLAALQQQVTTVIDTLAASDFRAVSTSVTNAQTPNRNYLIWIALIAVLTTIIVMVAQLIKKQKKIMYIYNVTIQITHAIHERWLQWMQQIHIPEVMATQCFTNYTMVRLLDIDESEGVTYAVQYKAASKQDYERYISHFSPALRQAGIDAWGNQFIAFRSLMQVVH